MQVKFDDDRILDILCEDPDFNDSVLTMTLNTHGDTLSIEDKLLITTALQPAAQRDETARFDQPKVNCQKKSSMPGFFELLPKKPKNLLQKVLLNAVKLNADIHQSSIFLKQLATEPPEDDESISRKGKP